MFYTAYYYLTKIFYNIIVLRVKKCDLFVIDILYINASFLNNLTLNHDSFF